MTTKSIAPETSVRRVEHILLFASAGIILMGLLMVTSASMAISEKQFGGAFHYLWKQMSYLGLGLIIALIMSRIPTEKIEYFSPILLMFAGVALISVLLPGIGREVNGSSRWLGIGSLGIQVSEVAKLFTILYVAGYIHRHLEEVRRNWLSFFKPMGILLILAVLLLLEPDFGSTVVLSTTILGMMFLAGAPLRIFGLVVAGTAAVFALLAISSPYRLARLTTFLDPWQHQYGSGYQLTQSLIAFGRGGLTGVGLGNSVQKLFYLPEAHTDFLFAVLAEELGLMGVLLVITLFSLLVYCGFMIGRAAFKKNRYFNAYLAYGLSLWIGLQALINMGVNAGLLPTKGLTLPLMSYGGSSLIVLCAALGLLFRIDAENRLG
ncbi:MAG: putative lipid II flippase FtsW [Legionellales bacterium]|nr:putative lipid II flippase FtsW [Legionellales bacterium]